MIAIKHSGDAHKRVFGIEKAPHECEAFRIFWLPDLDSNQGPAD